MDESESDGVDTPVSDLVVPVVDAPHLTKTTWRASKHHRLVKRVHNFGGVQSLRRRSSRRPSGHNSSLADRAIAFCGATEERWNAVPAPCVAWNEGLLLESRGALYARPAGPIPDERERRGGDCRQASQRSPGALEDA